MKRNEQYNDQMVDILEYAHQWVPGHSLEESSAPVRCGFDGDYLTFERAKEAQSSKRNSRTPSRRLWGLISRLSEFHNQAELLTVSKIYLNRYK